MSKAFSFFSVSILLIISIVMGYLGLKSVRLAEAAKNWPAIEGEVSSISVEKGYRGTKDTSAYNTYYPVIIYKYMVKNNEYKLKETKEENRDKSHAESYVNSHSVGTKQTIYYNPSNPSQSTLNPMTNKNNGYIQMIISGIMIIFLVIVLSGIVRNKNLCEM